MQLTTKFNLFFDKIASISWNINDYKRWMKEYDKQRDNYPKMEIEGNDYRIDNHDGVENIIKKYAHID